MLVKPLRVIRETYIDCCGDKEEGNIAVFDSASVNKIKSAYEKFKGRKGVIYKRIQEVSNHFYPNLDDFLDYCFGEFDDGYLNYDFVGIKGTTKHITRRLYELFKSMEWVDHRNQRAFLVDDQDDFFLLENDCW